MCSNRRQRGQKLALQIRVSTAVIRAGVDFVGEVSNGSVDAESSASVGYDRDRSKRVPCQ